MNNKNIFKALSSQTRLRILKLLMTKETHLTALAKEIGISKPVTSRHIKILEDAGLINKKVIGNVHVLSARIKNLEKALEPLIEKSTLKVNKEKSLFDALKQIPTIEIKKTGKSQYIQSIDGEEGYYIYEVDGELPEKPIDEYVITKKITIDLKKLVLVKKKKIIINVKQDWYNNIFFNQSFLINFILQK